MKCSILNKSCLCLSGWCFPHDNQGPYSDQSLTFSLLGFETTGRPSAESFAWGLPLGWITTNKAHLLMELSTGTNRFGFCCCLVSFCQYLQYPPAIQERAGYTMWLQRNGVGHLCFWKAGKCSIFIFFCMKKCWLYTFL